MNQLSNLLQLANFPMYGQGGGMFPQQMGGMYGGFGNPFQPSNPGDGSAPDGGQFGFQAGSVYGGSGSAPNGPFRFQPSPVGPVSGGGGNAPSPIGLRPSPWGGYGDGGMNNLMMMHQLGRSGSGFGGY